MNRADITADLASLLVGDQFPQWADLPITSVEPNGWDNVTFRLGDEKSLRLPTAEGYVTQIDKEHRWLPQLAPQLPLAIPQPFGRGVPGRGYPWPWSVYGWLPGSTAAVDRISDPSRFGTELGEFLAALRGVDPAKAPRAGHRQVLRVGALQTQDAETRTAIAQADKELDAPLALKVWEAALNAPVSQSPVWIHGDLAPNNLLVDDGRLSAVIDFGCSGVGDPAIDLEIAWGEFSQCRDALRASVQLDDPTWARARGWKLWGSVRALAEGLQTDADWLEWPRQIIADVLADHASAT